MRFGHTIVYVRDVPRCVEFYEKAFGLKRRFLHESGHYAELDTGRAALAIASVDLAASNLPETFRAGDAAEHPSGVEVAFATSDVPAAYLRAIEAGATPVAEPEKKPWGQTIAYVRDPDGMLVEIAGSAEDVGSNNRP